MSTKADRNKVPGQFSTRCWAYLFGSCNKFVQHVRNAMAHLWLTQQAAKVTRLLTSRLATVVRVTVMWDETQTPTVTGQGLRAVKGTSSVMQQKAEVMYATSNGTLRAPVLCTPTVIRTNSAELS